MLSPAASSVALVDFFAREFREHDYELGRRNCQKFLREYFALPRDIAEKTLTAGISTNYIFTNGGPAEYYPVIPILKGTDVNDEQGAGNKWPQYSPKHYGILEQNVRNRAEALVAKTLPLSWFWQPHGPAGHHIDWRCSSLRANL